MSYSIFPSAIRYTSAVCLQNTFWPIAVLPLVAYKNYDIQQSCIGTGAEFSLLVTRYRYREL